jgi:hypothetical protein
MHIGFSRLAAKWSMPVAPFIVLKCLHWHRISSLTALRIRSRGLSASTDATFRRVVAARGVPTAFSLPQRA